MLVNHTKLKVINLKQNLTNFCMSFKTKYIFKIIFTVFQMYSLNVSLQSFVFHQLEQFSQGNSDVIEAKKNMIV